MEITENERNSNITLKNQSYKILLIVFTKMFLKVFFLRVGYSFLKLIIQYKKLQKLNLILLLKVIFSFSNIRTSLSISFLPLSYKILKILYRHLFGTDKHANITTIIFGLFSGILSIIMEEKLD